VPHPPAWFIFVLGFEDDEDDEGGGCTCTDGIGTGFGDVMICAGVVEGLVVGLEDDGGGDCT